MKKLVFLADIDFEASPRVRAEINPETAQEYADAIKGKAILPPPDVFQANGSKHFLVADGRHRLQGIRLLGRKACECELHQGGYEAALKFALLANIKHGLRRSNADKRACAEAGVRQWPSLTVRELAEICGVSHELISAIRSANMPEDDKKEGGEKSSESDRSNESQEENKENSSSEEKESKKKEDKKPPEPPKDDMGFPIPKTLLPFWDRRQEIQDLMTKISQIRSALKAYQDGKDASLSDLYNALGEDLSLIYLTISDRKPYAVCVWCGGELSYRDAYGKRDCKACFKSGLISKSIYDKAPANLKEKRSSEINK